jgi:hypothetical protein
VTDERATEIRPEPAPAERRAVEAALAAARERGEEPVRSAWWRAGVRENAGDPSLEPPD